MAERRSWTEQEDMALKYLKDVLQVKKWSEISRRMQFEYNLPGRNGKQCRERYTNHLDSTIISKEFTLEDEQKLFQLHDSIGNRWSLISKQFQGRTDNQIKNHFHSKLRKGIRKLNKEIKIHFKKTIKPFKLNLIYKVVEASDYRFSEKISQTLHEAFDFNQLKNFVLQYASGQVVPTQLSSMKSKEQTLFLVSRLNEFDNYFKTKKLGSKEERNQKIQSAKNCSKKSHQKGSKLNWECSSQISNEIQPEDAEESISLYEDASFQFVANTQRVNQTSKSMEEETNNGSEEQKAENKRSLDSSLTTKGSMFYSFSNLVKQNPDQKNNFQNIPLNLIEEKQFPEVSLNRRFSVQSFESLKEYEDSLNESELCLMMRRFDSYSDIEAGLFE